MLLEKLRSAVTLVLLIGAACGLGALAWSRPAPAQPPDVYRVALSDGATIEVIAVSSDSQTWWRPDGTPLAEPPIDRVDVGVRRPDREGRLILARVSGLPHGDTLKWLPSHDGEYTGGTASQGGRRVAGLEYYHATFRPGRDTCEVQVRLAAGPWQTLAAHDGSGGYSTVKGEHKFYFGKARAHQGGTAISVAENLVDRDSRVVAVDLEGREHAPAYASGGGGAILSLLDVEFPGLPPDRIREYRVQSREFERAEIRGIALRPASGSAAAAQVGDEARERPGREPRRHHAITLTHAYWADDPDAAASVRGFLGHDDGAGHVVMHGDEWFDERDHHQYKEFFASAGTRFLFRAEGHPDVHGTLTRAFVTSSSHGLREMEIRIPPDELARMAPGVAYELTPVNEPGGSTWRTRGRLTIVRALGSRPRH